MIPLPNIYSLQVDAKLCNPKAANKVGEQQEKFTWTIKNFIAGKSWKYIVNLLWKQCFTYKFHSLSPENWMSVIIELVVISNSLSDTDTTV
jgi:hypothetical protein